MPGHDSDLREGFAGSSSEGQWLPMDSGLWTITRGHPVPVDRAHGGGEGAGGSQAGGLLSPPGFRQRSKSGTKETTRAPSATPPSA